MTDRISRVCARLAETGVDALLVSNLVNVRWLTGFSGSNGWVVLAPDGVALVTDGRYGVQAERQLAEAGVHAEVLVGLSGGEVMEHIGRRCSRYARVGFESAHVTVASHQQYVEAMPGVVLMPVTGVVEAERRTKEPSEIDRIARACAIADRALADVVPLLGTGLTEAQVRNLLDQRMREFGADGPSYDTIVAAGPVHAALPHHAPTHTLLEPGHTVIIDVGALVDGYHSDMTRSFVVGEPSAQQLEMYQLVLASQLAGLAAVQPGASTIDVDRACRSVIADAGVGDWFSHGTGHGVGLLIHEDPFVNRVTPGILQVGDVVTVEPGVYHEGFGGIRVEDLVVVTSDGCRVLTSSPKDSPCPQSPPTT
jgi:Xaa-Pro aminopeptidase